MRERERREAAKYTSDEQVVSDTVHRQSPKQASHSVVKREERKKRKNARKSEKRRE